MIPPGPTIGGSTRTVTGYAQHGTEMVGSGGGVGRRTRAPQRGRRVALPAPRQPLRGRRQSQTGVRGHGTGAGGTGGAPSTPADVLSTLMLPTGPLAAAARSPAPAVTATGGVRGAVWSDRRDSGPNPGRLPLNPVSPENKITRKCHECVTVCVCVPQCVSGWIGR